MATALVTLTKEDVAGSGIADAHFEARSINPRDAINAALGAANALVSGAAIIALGNAAITITAATLGGSYGGKPVFVAINEATEDTTLFRLRYSWTGNDLVISGNANATAAVDVTFLIDARA